MKNWQKNRNYRKYENADGSFIYKITVDGQDVEVDFEVYKAYSKADRRERYDAERDEGRLLSLDRMYETGESLADLHTESPEDTAIRNISVQQLNAAMRLLDDGDRELIRRLYLNGVSIRKYAAEKGLSDFTIRYREGKLLGKIKDFMKS